jgi:D-threonate/D-erythronate kinase
MIIVLADDFTGAAELAGIALKYGLSTEVLTSGNLNTDAEVNIIDTNTRSRPAGEACREVDRILEEVDKFGHSLLFKKTDSVFRGHVLDELSVLLKRYPRKSVILAPANPSRGRTITDGHYFIDGQLLHESVFSADPESPAIRSDIMSLLKVGTGVEVTARVLKLSDDIPDETGEVWVAEARSADHVMGWASRVNNRIIPAGSADFFDAMLSLHVHPISQAEQKSLFICGSSLSRVVNLEEELFSENPKVVHVSEDHICVDGHGSLVREIAKAVSEYFKVTNNVILFVKASETSNVFPTRDIPKCLAAITAKVLDQIAIRELYIEGGTTSSEVMRKAGWRRFKPVHQLDEGIVRLHVLDCPSSYVTVKPGSYKWPTRFKQNRMSNQKLET